MKVEQEVPAFRKVTITFETREEFDDIAHALNEVNDYNAHFSVNLIELGARLNDIRYGRKSS